MTEPGGWLDSLRGEREQIETVRQGVFESGIVSRILRFGEKNPTVIGNYRREVIARGDHDLSFVWFNEFFPRFPVILGAQKIPFIQNLTVANLFGPCFMKLPMMREYQKLQLQLGIDDREQRIGLVFMWPHVPTAGTMVLHNYPIEVDRVPDPSLRAERNTRIVRPFGNPTVVYVIDPLDEFLISVGKDWAEE